MAEVPLGESEGQRLEFKSRGALDSPDSIAREVVAMLNADGGDIWIGVGEIRGRAASVEGVEEPARAIRSLRDLLIDTIEPSPLDDEVKVEQVFARDTTVLVVRVRPKLGSRPYAQKRRNARTFVIRVNDGIRPMSRGEMVQQLTNVVEDPSLDKGLDLLESRMKERPGFFGIGVQPLYSTGLESQDPHLRVLLSDPEATSNRRAGWNFLYPAGPTVAKDRLELGDHDSRLTRIYEDGSVYFRARLESLIHGGKSGEIWPLALIEFPVSVVRLAGAVFERFTCSKEISQVLVDAAFWRIEDWTLRPYSPGAVGYQVHGSRSFPDKDLVWDRPLQFRLQEIVSEPDRCGGRLVRRIYQAFGYEDQMIPEVFDPETGRLTL